MGLYLFTEKVRNLIDSMRVAARMKNNSRYIADGTINWTNIRERSRETEGRDIVKVDDVQFDVYKDRVTIHLPTHYRLDDKIEKTLQSMINDLKIAEYFKVYDNKYIIEMPFYDEDSMIEVMSRILLIYV
jgi:hypothetical protein